MKPRLPRPEEIFVLAMITVFGLLVYFSIYYPEYIIHPVPYEYMDTPMYHRDPLLSFEGVQYA